MGKALADEDFSHVLSELYPKKYMSPMSWLTSHGGKTGPGKAPEDAVNDIRDHLGYSEKQGYKIQSTAGEEWERTKREIGVSRDTISDYVQEALKILLPAAEKPYTGWYGSVAIRRPLTKRSATSLVVEEWSVSTARSASHSALPRNCCCSPKRFAKKNWKQKFGTPLLPRGSRGSFTLMARDTKPGSTVRLRLP
ncbi:MAG: hypothetical protein IID44_09305 [Planctomycetes bacterium]|nr:hypothetical protein [Planctomycetota bacterium]